MVWLGGSSCVFYHGGGGLVEHGGFVVRLAAAFRNIDGVIALLEGYITVRSSFFIQPGKMYVSNILIFL